MTTDLSKHQIDLCIIGGTGRVGLPLALVFASKGFRVLIYDTNKSRLETISQGTVPFLERDAESLLQQALEQDKLYLSSDPTSITNVPILIVTVSTSFDEFMNPVLRTVKQTTDELLPHLSNDQLLILRSTVYPGITDWLDKYLRARGKNIKIAFCPERVSQGNAVEEIQQWPQLVSGTTLEAEQEASEIFAKIASEVVFLSPMEAELAKLFNNAYRYIQFAVANQFYMMANFAGVDYYRILEGMKRNYPRAQDILGAGFTSGPALARDTMLLATFFDNHFNLGQAAKLVNEGLVMHIIEQIDKKHKLEHLNIGLLGMSYKAESDDINSSLSYKLKNILAFRAKEIFTTDPHVTTDPELLPLETVLSNSNLLILCVPHSAYQRLDTQGKPIVDIWDFLGKETYI